MSGCYWGYRLTLGAWLFYGLAFLAAHRPVVMTAARRDRLQNDADALPLAMRAIEELSSPPAQDGKGGAR
jgi:hypothetical protein